MKRLIHISSICVNYYEDEGIHSLPFYLYVNLSLTLFKQQFINFLSSLSVLDSTGKNSRPFAIPFKLTVTFIFAFFSLSQTIEYLLHRLQTIDKKPQSSKLPYFSLSQTIEYLLQTSVLAMKTIDIKPQSSKIPI